MFTLGSRLKQNSQRTQTTPDFVLELLIWGAIWMGAELFHISGLGLHGQWLMGKMLYHVYIY